MLGRCFSLGGVVGVAGLIVWAGCSSDSDVTIPPPADGGAGDSAVSNDAATGAADAKADVATFVGVPVQYGNCPAFTKCGGDIAGDWTFSGGCLKEETFAEAKASCAGLQESNVVIEASGTISATATTVTRNTTLQVTGNVFVPKCQALLTNCGTVQVALTSGLLPGGLKFDKAECTATTTPADGCNCAISTKLSDGTSGTYTTTPDGTLTTASKTYEYCVAGNKLSVMETTASQALKLVTESTK